MARPSQTPENKKAIADLIAFWEKENVNAKARAKFDDVMLREMLTVGVPMSLVLTAAWLVWALVRERSHKTAAL